MPVPLPLANVNGEVLPLAEVRISPLDRGFLFGDAVYEVLRVYAGKPFLAPEHFERLKNSLAAIRLGGVDLGRMRQRMEDTLARSEVREGIVYIQVTRGAAPRKHPFPKDAPRNPPRAICPCSARSCSRIRSMIPKCRSTIMRQNGSGTGSGSSWSTPVVRLVSTAALETISR